MTEPLDFSKWVGRSQQRVDWVNPNHLAAWNATLDRDDPFPREGDPAPETFHWCLFPPLARQSELGPDGHARRGGFLPPVPLPRRMWAGSRLRFPGRIHVGEKVELVSLIEKVEAKSGRAGSLVFVTVRHTVSGAGGPAIVEEQDIVYREAPRAGAAAPPLEPAPRSAWSRKIVPDEVLLFRYSALTFNGHRIHYDRRYVTGEEGYAGLVVHGPLLATLLVDLVRRQRPGAAVERFRFRGLRPTVDTTPFTVEGEPGADPGQIRLWTTENLGQVGLEAEAWIR
ncbi:MAG: MaoC family dehydratase N-terminal domain-containing protein [Deltaproteobacteria bacterium]|nr:MaoC family dehydratase N-terminal domain-containing protein [Deltaproteobacteria bacterium]